MNILLLITCVMLIAASLFFIGVLAWLVIDQKKANREMLRLQREKVHWAPDMSGGRPELRSTEVDKREKVVQLGRWR